MERPDPGRQGLALAVDDSALTIVNGNVDDDPTPELTIAIEDGTVLASAYTETDFVA